MDPGLPSGCLSGREGKFTPYCDVIYFILLCHFLFKRPNVKHFQESIGIHLDRKYVFSYTKVTKNKVVFSLTIRIYIHKEQVYLGGGGGQIAPLHFYCSPQHGSAWGFVIRSCKTDIRLNRTSENQE